MFVPLLVSTAKEAFSLYTLAGLVWNPLLSPEPLVTAACAAGLIHPLPTGAGVLVTVDVLVGVPVSVGGAVGVEVSVFVGVYVTVGVLVSVGVDVGVSVGVLVGVSVAVGVKVGVDVGVSVGVLVRVEVSVGIKGVGVAAVQFSTRKYDQSICISSLPVQMPRPIRPT